MFSFSTPKLTKSKSVLLDIQSGLVRGAFVRFHHGEASLISSVVTKYIPSIPLTDESGRMEKEILKVVSDVLQSIMGSVGHEKIDTIHYILSSPWIFSDFKSEKVNFEKETKINHGMVDNLLKKQMERTKLSPDIQHVEIKVCEVRLNGYVMENFEGKTAKNLEVFFYNSYGSKAFFDKLTVLVQKMIHIKNHEYHSALLLQYSALRLVNTTREDYLYIHVHSELTDVVAVKNGLCKHISSFPFGTTSLLRKISEITNQSLEASDSLLTLYQNDKLEEKEKEKMKAIIDPLLIKWNESWIKNLSEEFGLIYIPRTVYLSVHSHLEVFKYALLFHNDLNFDILSYDNIPLEGLVEFDKNSTQSILMKLYTLVLSNMV
jgi:hypothetical protein